MTSNPQVVTPLLVPPKEAWKLLNCGNTKGYELIKQRKLEVVKLGTKSTRITMSSIMALVNGNK